MTPELWESICHSSLGHRSSQEQTYDLARLVLQRGIPGDFVECGVYAGASCALMAHAIMDHWEEVRGPIASRVLDKAEMLAETARVHLFDTFAGIPALGVHDRPSEVTEGEAACAVESVMRNMERWGVPAEMLVYHRGDLRQTVTHAQTSAIIPNIEQIALLRLDADLYESTKAALALYELVSPGGYVIIDDYDLHGCRIAVEDYFGGGRLPAPMVWRKPR